jgi:hypothetical protein
MRVLTDVDVRMASAATTVKAAREALGAILRWPIASTAAVARRGWRGRLHFTVGAVTGGASGFRVYRTGDRAGDQLVAVCDEDARLTGLVVGDELGARRTGALGAVASDVPAAAVAAGHMADRA